MLNKLFFRFLATKVTSCDLAVVLLTIAGMVAAVDSALRALSDDVKLNHQNHNNRLLDNKKAHSIPALSSSKTLPPFGSDILKGYQSCDEFKSDLVKFLSASGTNFIQNQKNYSYCYYNDTISNNTYYNNPIPITYSQGTRRAQKQETSYGTNNQVANVQEKDLIQSDGKYIYAANVDRILVSDLNGKVVANFTVPSPPLRSVNQSSYVGLDSIFINNNILTVFASMGICDFNCTDTYSVFYYSFNPKTKAMTLKKQYNDISSPFSSFDARQIGDYTYLLASSYFGDLYWPLSHCNEDFKDLSADEYEAAALAYLNSNVNRYASVIVAELSKEGATSTCNNVIKIFNETLQQFDVSFAVTKVFSIGLSGTSKKSYFFPFSSYASHISKNSILVSTQGNNFLGDTFLIKFSVKDSVVTPTSVGTLDGSLLSQYGIDLYNGYYRIASSSSTTGEAQVTVLQEQNSQLKVVGHVIVGAGAIQSVRFYNERGFLVTTTWNVYYNESSSIMSLVNLTSPANPSTAATEILTNPLYNMQPIEYGKYIISIDNTVSKVNSSGITVYLFEATDNSLKQVGQPLEVIIAEQVDGYLPWVNSDAMWDPHALRYLSQSHKLIIPVSVINYGYYNITDVNDAGNFQGFYAYDVDLAKGVKLLGNVTHDFANYCSPYPSRSMAFNGDLITFMGNTIKRTSSVTTLSNLKWELENYCGFS